MFGISGAEVMVILLVALIVLGPDRLPQVARKAGQVFAELRKVSAGFEAEMRTAMYDSDRPTPHPQSARHPTPAGPELPAQTAETAETADDEGPRPGESARNELVDPNSPTEESDSSELVDPNSPTGESA
ncbi:MAG: twin-arginine translocase TatA/TatE family subunit [Acidimicrobiales bacterium]|nr:twin-arginine translocase TatA/TatE family subunit [Acidimicrobiales bacterium]